MLWFLVSAILIPRNEDELNSTVNRKIQLTRRARSLAWFYSASSAPSALNYLVGSGCFLIPHSLDCAVSYSGSV